MAFFVGVAGFEPATSCSQSRRDNRATLHPETFGFQCLQLHQGSHPIFIVAERGGFEPPVGVKPTPAFQASAFDHSATSPGALHVRQTKVRNEKNGQIRGIPRHRSNGKSSDLIRKPSSRAIHSLVSLLLMLLGREPVGPDTPSPERTSSHLNLPP